MGIFSSCKCKKLQHTIEKKDSIVINNLVTKTLPAINYIEFDKPCDTFGNIRPIFLKSTSGKNSVVVSSNNGKLQISTQIDSTTNVNSKVYNSKQQKEKIVVEKKVIPKLFYYSIFGNIIFLLFLIWKIKRFFSF